jgi:uncharacterized protein
MKTPKWLLSLSICLLGLAPPALSAEIHDRAGMFDRDTIRTAKAELDRIEKTYRVPVAIETVESLRAATTQEEQREWKDKKKQEVADLVAEKRAKEQDHPGIYILIAKDNHAISNVLIPKRLETVLPRARRVAIHQAFVENFNKNKEQLDKGLESGIKTIQSELSESSREKGSRPAAGGAVPAAPRPGPVAAPRAPAPAPQGRSGIGTWIFIGLIILGIFLVIRMLGGLFRGPSSYAGGAPMQGPGGPGGPGGYGGGGYGGGGGGGFFSSLFGGIGGALAGNWIYDQMSGRHQQHGGPSYGESSSYGTGAPASYDPGPSGGDEIIGTGDDRESGGAWGDTGGGGDWVGGGGDTGGGGDWGGGGDTGGGGDWGGGGDGGGGGDW